jgi:hypothetical protein
MSAAHGPNTPLPDRSRVVPRQIEQAEDHREKQGEDACKGGAEIDTRRGPWCGPLRPVEELGEIKQCGPHDSGEHPQVGHDVVDDTPAP